MKNGQEHIASQGRGYEIQWNAGLRPATSARADDNIPFALGHAWGMKAVHGSKTKCDRKDAEAIARLLKGGNFPLAYAYPEERRGLRDLQEFASFGGHGRCLSTWPARALLSGGWGTGHDRQ